MATPDRPRFAVVRKGFDQTEVLAHLAGVEAELADLRTRAAQLQAGNAGLEAEIAELRERLESVPSLPSAGELDDTAIAAAVGEEMANVIRTARGVAEDLRSRASTESEQMLAGAREEAAEIVRHARAEADETLSGARAEATEGLESARAEAARTVEAAKADADRLVQEAHADAERTREEATRLYAARTEEANRKMAEATAEAERHAAGIRAKATVEVEAILARASTEAAAMRGEADRERRVALEQAQAARDRILADLARRRRVATVQIEQLRAGRERLLVSYGIVRRTLEEVSDEFQRADAEARAAAEEAGRRLASDVGADAESDDHRLVPAAADDPEPGQAAGGVGDAAGAEGDEPDAGTEGEEPGGVPEGERAAEPTVGSLQGAPSGVPSGPEDGTGTSPVRFPGEPAPAGPPADPGGPFPGLAVSVGRGGTEPDRGVSAPSSVRAVPAVGIVRPADPSPAVSAVDAPPVIDLRPTITLRSGLAGVTEETSRSDSESAVLAGVGARGGRQSARGRSRPVPGLPDAPAPPVDVSVPDAPTIREDQPSSADEAATPAVGVADGGAPSEDPVTGIFERIRAGRARAVQQAHRTLDPEPVADPEPGPAPEPADRQSAARRDSVAGPEPVADPEPVVDPEPVAGPEPVADREESGGTGTGSGDEEALARRDEALRTVARDLTRKLKRELQDEQSELLDRLRELGESGALDALLPPVAGQRDRYATVAAPLLARAARAGASAAELDAPTAAPGRSADTGELAGRLSDALSAPLRRRLATLVSELGDPGDREALVDALSAAYREVKTGRVEPVALDHLCAAHVLGWWTAVADGTELRWVASDVGGTCSDCDDNTLAGGVPQGGAFPTGHLLPPAHEGCRCLLVAGD